MNLGKKAYPRPCSLRDHFMLAAHLHHNNRRGGCQPRFLLHCQHPALSNFTQLHWFKIRVAIEKYSAGVLLREPFETLIPPELSSQSNSNKLSALRELESWTPKVVDSASSSPIPHGAEC